MVDTESSTPSIAGSSTETTKGTTGRSIGEPSTWWSFEVLMVVDPQPFALRNRRVSAQPDEQRIVRAGHPVNDAGMRTVNGEPFEQRTKFVGIIDDVARIVQRHPPATQPFDLISLHIVHPTRYPKVGESRVDRPGARSNTSHAFSPRGSGGANRVEKGPDRCSVTDRPLSTSNPDEQPLQGDDMTPNESPATPAQLMTNFAERAGRGDAEGLLELYEPAAVFEPQLGVMLRGTAEIGAALAGFAAMRPTIIYVGEPDVVVVDDIALVSNTWTMTAQLPDGSTHNDGGVSADVLRRQSDGTWRVLIDQPRGATLAP